jgi:NAD(P)H-dependent FMN reductase
MRLVGISGSLRKASCNGGLLRYCQEVLSEKGIKLDIVSPQVIGALPLFNEEIETAPGSAVGELREHLEGADGYVFATCEYNGSISAPLKNALDWGSREGNPFDGKPVSIIGAGGYAGTTRAQGHLRDICFNLNMKNMNGGFGSGLEVRIQIFQDKPAPFDEDGNLIGPFWQDELRNKTMPGFMKWANTINQMKD